MRTRPGRRESQLCGALLADACRPDSALEVRAMNFCSADLVHGPALRYAAAHSGRSCGPDSALADPATGRRYGILLLVDSYCPDSAFDVRPASYEKADLAQGRH